MTRQGFQRKQATSTEPEGTVMVVTNEATGNQQEALSFTPTTSTVARACEVLAVTDFTTGADTTLTAAGIAGGIYTRDPNGGARTDTLPLGTDLDIALPAL